MFTLTGLVLKRKPIIFLSMIKLSIYEIHSIDPMKIIYKKHKMTQIITQGFTFINPIVILMCSILWYNPFFLHNIKHKM